MYPENFALIFCTWKTIYGFQEIASIAITILTAAKAKVNKERNSRLSQQSDRLEKWLWKALLEISKANPVIFVNIVVIFRNLARWTTSRTNNLSWVYPSLECMLTLLLVFYNVNGTNAASLLIAASPSSLLSFIAKQYYGSRKLLAKTLHTYHCIPSEQLVLSFIIYHERERGKSLFGKFWGYWETLRHNYTWVFYILVWSTANSIMQLSGWRINILLQ